VKIGVIADTHLDAPTALLERVVHQHFRDTDIILHAGDIHSLDVLDAFKGKQIYAVAGNCDPEDVREKLPQQALIRLGRFKVGLIHGWGFPFGISRRVASLFDQVDCVVFGHTHWASSRWKNGMLFLNPGTFKGGIFSFWRRSVGLLTLDRRIQSHIIWL
jgi:putative phosphoesterase